MLEQRRQPGPFSIAADVAGLLAGLRAAAGVSTPAELDIDRLREVEAAVGMRFGNDLLAVFACGVPALVEALEIRVGLVLGHTGELRRRRARGDLIAFGAARGLFHCVEKREVPRERTEVVEYDADGGGERRMDLADWLRERGAEPGTEPFTPTLAARMPESYQGRTVRHKVFGEGKLLSESGSGPTRKVKVDFPGVGLKLLQARFLEFPDD